jgi:F-type H+-transporting ATPase subunit c
MDEMTKVAAYLAAAFAIGIGTLGPALSQGLIGSRACRSLGEHPESANKIQTLALVAMAMVETLALFAFITVILLIVSVR